MIVEDGYCPNHMVGIVVDEVSLLDCISLYHTILFYMNYGCDAHIFPSPNTIFCDMKHGYQKVVNGIKCLFL